MSESKQIHRFRPFAVLMLLTATCTLVHTSSGDAVERMHGREQVRSLLGRDALVGFTSNEDEGTSRSVVFAPFQTEGFESKWRLSCPPRCLALSGDQQFVAGLGSDGVINVLDASSGDTLMQKELGVVDPDIWTAWLGGSEHLVTVANGTAVTVWARRGFSLEKLSTMNRVARVKGLAASTSSGEYLVFSSECVAVGNPSSSRFDEREYESAHVLDAHFVGNEGTIIVALSNGMVDIWDRPTGGESSVKTGWRAPGSVKIWPSADSPHALLVPGNSEDKPVVLDTHTASTVGADYIGKDRVRWAGFEGNGKTLRLLTSRRHVLATRVVKDVLSTVRIEVDSKKSEVAGVVEVASRGDLFIGAVTATSRKGSVLIAFDTMIGAVPLSRSGDQALQWSYPASVGHGLAWLTKDSYCYSMLDGVVKEYSLLANSSTTRHTAAGALLDICAADHKVARALVAVPDRTMPCGIRGPLSVIDLSGTSGAVATFGDTSVRAAQFLSREIDQVVTIHSSGSVVFWKLAEGTAKRVLESPSRHDVTLARRDNWSACIASSGEGAGVLITASDGPHVIIWDASEKAPVSEHFAWTPTTTAESIVVALQVSSDANFAVCAGRDRLILWNNQNWEAPKIVSTKDVLPSISDVCLDGERGIVYACGGRWIVAMDATNGTVLGTSSTAPSMFTRMKLAPDGKRLAGHMSDGRITYCQVEILFENK